jgi:hypothetical protein
MPESKDPENLSLTMQHQGILTSMYGSRVLTEKGLRCLHLKMGLTE